MNSAVLVVLLATTTTMTTPAKGRQVNWFLPKGGVARSHDGLNSTAWAAQHKNALTGIFPCCGCWATDARNGSFITTHRCPGRTNAEEDGRREARELKAMNLSVVPTGGMTTAWLLNKTWEQPGILESAALLVQREGWDGLQVDDESFPGSSSWDPRLPPLFGAFVGNLSATLAVHGLRCVVDVCSTWHNYIIGPEVLPSVAKRAPAATFMDMSTYFAKGFVPGGDIQQLLALKTMMPLNQIAVGVGLTEMPGHTNASCGGFPQCTNFSNPACGCLDYGWNESSFRSFISAAAVAGVTEIDVWRQDMTPPPNTTAYIPPWWSDTLAGFLANASWLYSTA